MFEWDAGKAARNLEKHGVTFFEAGSVFTDSEALDLLDRRAAELAGRHVG